MERWNDSEGPTPDPTAPTGGAPVRSRLAIGATALALGMGASVGCDDDDEQGPVEEAGEAAEDVGQEAEQQVEEADKEVGEDE
jgi:hypothetical protein